MLTPVLTPQRNRPSPQPAIPHAALGRGISPLCCSSGPLWLFYNNIAGILENYGRRSGAAAGTGNQVSAECIGRSVNGALSANALPDVITTETLSSDAAIYGKAGNKQLEYEKSLNRYGFSEHHTRMNFGLALVSDYPCFAAGGLSTATGRMTRKKNMLQTPCCTTATTCPGLRPHQILSSRSGSDKSSSNGRKTSCLDRFQFRGL